MANHRSAEKRNRQAQVRRLRNKINKKKMKTAVRRFDEAVAAGAVEDVQKVLRDTTSIIAKTASKGTIHKKKASRKIARLTKRMKAVEAAAQ